MSDLNYYQDIIKEKRKQTSFRDFLKEIVSWHPFVLNKNQNFISRFPDTQRVQICSNKEFNENRDDLVKNGKNYDFSIDFFENFKILFQNTKLPNVFHYQENENSDYTDIAVDSKNAYLSNSVVLYSQNVLYSFMVRGECVNVINSLFVTSNSENIYFSRGIINSYKVFYSSYINNSSNIWFSSNLIGCSECIFCTNLENHKYCINNKIFEKEEYFIEKEKILKDKNNYDKYFLRIEDKGNNYGSEKVTGNYVVQSNNIFDGHYVFNTINAKNIMFIGAKSVNENFYDVFIAGGSGRYDNYAVASTGGSDNIYCSSGIGYSMNIYYSYFLESCSYCLGCVGLKNKSYCILNKQYTKEEWEILVDKIFSQMDNDGILGKFFPGNLNPFYFNDTMAGMLGDFTKEEVEKEGYMWREDEIKVDIPDGAEVVRTNPPVLTDIPLIKGESCSVAEIGGLLSDFQGYDSNGNWQINPEILKKVIKDEKGNVYRIVKLEYDFLMKYGLPIPEIHWLDRMKVNFGLGINI